MDKECYYTQTPEELKALQINANGNQKIVNMGKCDQKKLLREGKNLNFVYKNYSEKLYNKVQSGLTGFDPIEVSKNLAAFQSDGTCLSTESSNACLERHKRALNDARMHIRESNLKYNDAIAGMFSEEGKVRQASAPSDPNSSKEPTQNGLLRDFYDVSRLNANQKVKDDRYRSLYQFNNLSFSKPGEYFDPKAAPKSDSYLKLSQDKFDFIKANPEHTKDKKDQYSPSDISEGYLSGDTKQDATLLKARETIWKRDEKGYKVDQQKYEQAQKILNAQRQKNAAPYNSTSEEAFKETMTELNEQVKKADAKSRGVAQDKGQGIKDIDRDIHASDEVKDSEEEIEKDAGVLKQP